MAQCIICLREHSDTTVEHIVPRSLGNIHYVLPKGRLCGVCNNRFAKYEHAVLSSKGWLDHRIALGLVRHRDDVRYTSPKEYELRRFLLKMIYEGLYHSRRSLFDKLDLVSIRIALSEGRDLAVTVTPDKMIKDATDIPRRWDAWRLRRNHISMQYRIGEETMFFAFRFKELSYVLKIEAAPMGLK